MSQREIHLSVTNRQTGVEAHVIFRGYEPEVQAVAFFERKIKVINPDDGYSLYLVEEYLVTEDCAILDEWTGEFIRMGTRVADDQPHVINPNEFRTLHALLHPTCHHGMSADLCMDPYGEHHFGTREQEMQWEIG